MHKLIFAGNGHGAIAAFNSLKGCFPNIEVLTEDEELLPLLRPGFDRRISDLLESECIHVVCAGYQKIVSSSILKKKVIVNTHPSLLPKYRGLHALAWAMLNRENELGFTIHLMNEYIDDGDILAQYKINYDNQTSKEIMDDFDNYVLHNLGQIVLDFVNGKITPKPQAKEKATWVAKRNLLDCLIDFSSSTVFLIALFKTLVSPYPLPQIVVNNRFYGIKEWQIIESYYYTHIGRVVNIEGVKAYVKIAEGLLLISCLEDTATKEQFPASKILKLGQRLL